ncbi:MAG: OmpA family protein [Saprospiraceae bacterium]
MSINLLDMLKDQVTGSLATQAAGFLGESEGNITKALGGAFPAILGSLITKSSEPSGAKGIMDMIGGVDMGMLSNIGGLFGGGASSVNGLLNSGGGILESLLGSKMGGIVDMITKLSGLKSGSTSSLLKMAAPFLIGMIGKQMKGKGLSFLTDMLMGQKSAVAKAMPSGMGNLLGFADGARDVVSKATNTASSAARTTANVATNTAKSGMGWLKWAFPLLLLGGLAWWMVGKGNPVDAVADKTKDMATAAANKTKDMANAAANMTSAAFSKVDAAAKAALDKVTFGANSAGSQMMAFINGGFKGDGKVTFRNLTFATGSAKIDTKSAVEIDNLAKILKAYPGVNIDVSGYTDNTGDAAKNVTLSSARANAVLGRLIAQGIDVKRISAKGYGSANPVAANNSAAGKAQNRRIEVTLRK